jgi:hypothetical protein
MTQRGGGHHSPKQYLLEVRKKTNAPMEMDEVGCRTRLETHAAHSEVPDPGAEPNARTSGGEPTAQAQIWSGSRVVIVELREMFDFPCGRRLAPILRREAGRLRQLGELHYSDEVAEKLKQMSPKTIDRLLARERRVRHLRRVRNPATQLRMYHKVPVTAAYEWDTREVGNVQLDYAAHCGRSSGGEYVHTISTVDIASG